MNRIIRRAERTVDDRGWFRRVESIVPTSSAAVLERFGELQIDRGDVPMTERHAGVELLWLVRDGVVGYTDSLGNDVRMLAGEVQLLSCGTGVDFTLRNLSPFEPLEMIVATIRSAAPDVEPTAERSYFSDDGKTDAMSLIAADNGDEALPIRQHVRVFASLPKRGYTMPFRVPDARQGFLYVLSGRARVGADELGAGDAAHLSPGEIQLGGLPEAEYLLFDLPSDPMRVQRGE